MKTYLGLHNNRAYPFSADLLRVFGDVPPGHMLDERIDTISSTDWDSHTVVMDSTAPVEEFFQAGVPPWQFHMTQKTMLI